MESIIFVEEGVRSIDISKKLFRDVIRYMIKNEGYSVGELTFIFCTDQYLLEINKKFLKHDYYTDIITFDYVEGDCISGDLFISVDRVEENAGIYGVSFKDELYRVILHGVLHLLGYKDSTDVEAEQIRLKENQYIEYLYGLKK